MYCANEVADFIKVAGSLAVCSKDDLLLYAAQKYSSRQKFEKGIVKI